MYLVGVLAHALGQLLITLQLVDEWFDVAFLHVLVHRLDARNDGTLGEELGQEPFLLCLLPCRFQLCDIVIQDAFSVVLQQRGFLCIALLTCVDGVFPCLKIRRVVGYLQHIVVHHRNLVDKFDELLHPSHALHVGGDAHSQFRGHLTDE